MYRKNNILHRNTRLQISFNLEGVCRFVLHDRNLTPNGYYQATIDCQNYLSDLDNMEPKIDRSELIQKYTNFFRMKKLDIDKDVFLKHLIFSFYQLWQC